MCDFPYVLSECTECWKSWGGIKFLSSIMRVWELYPRQTNIIFLSCSSDWAFWFCLDFPSWDTLREPQLMSPLPSPLLISLFPLHCLSTSLLLGMLYLWWWGWTSCVPGHKLTQLMLLWAGSALKPVPAESRMQTHEGDRPPKPSLLLSIFSRFLPVICIGQTPEQTTWQSERSILIHTQWWCEVFEMQRRWRQREDPSQGWSTPQFPFHSAQLMDPPAAHALSGSLSWIVTLLALFRRAAVFRIGQRCL